MADVMDVVSTLVAIVAATVYPNGTGQAPAAGCPPTKIFPGWPLPDQLQTDIGLCKAQINVYPRPEEHNTTRYTRAWRTTAYLAPTLTLTITGQTVTVGGTNTPPIAQNVAVIANGQPYVYAAQAADTLTSIATALSTLIAIGVPGTTSSGPVVTLPASATIQGVRVGGTGTLTEEVKRQERLIQIGIWASSPDFRTALAKAIDPVLAATDFISLPDGSAGRLIYKSSPMTDMLEKQQIYRRDLMYTVEYGTLLATPATEVVDVNVNLSPAGTDPPVPAAPAVIPYVTVTVTPGP